MLLTPKAFRLYLLLLFSSAACVMAKGQSNGPDSLLQQLTKAREDTNKVHTFYALSDIYETAEPAKAIGYVREGLALSKKLAFEAGVGKGYRNLAYIYSFQAVYDSLVYYSQLAYEIALKNADTLRIGVSLFNMGEGYKLQGDYEKGIEYTLRGVNMLEGKGYTNYEAALYAGLQSSYQMLKQYDKSVEYALKAMEAGRKLENKTSLLTSMVNLANCYEEMKQIARSEALYHEAIPLAQKLNNASIEATIYEGLFDIALQQKRYADAGEYVNKSLQLYTGIDNRNGVAMAHCNMALYHMCLKNFPQAIASAREGWRMAQENQLRDKEGEAAAILGTVYLAAHNFDSAFRYEDVSKRLTEQVFTEALTHKEAEMRVKYETEKKEAQILQQQSTLQQRKTMNYLLAGIAITLLVIATLGYRNFKHRQTIQQQKINELETEKQLAATEAILQGEEQERTRLAKDLHDGLGGMLSGIKHSFSNMKENLVMTPENAQAFERGIDMLDSSIKEMRRVAHNMMPEILLQYGLNTALKELCLEMDRSTPLQVTYQPIDMDTVQFGQSLSVTAYRVVQELANNVLKHAHATTLLVQAQASREDNILQLTVEDNGKGLDIAALAKSAGMGWKSIRNRIELVHGKIDAGAAQGNGTSVLIEIPLS
ncbi:signal transduction histidine kinase [Filimonas zeae]|nr:tetratricopeptide repeat-containing sensor histidine kinase [Filimonas zeae]MDR6338118.1 signal transduction histidine kinase [Filimonas zeae]